MEHHRIRWRNFLLHRTLRREEEGGRTNNISNHSANSISTQCRLRSSTTTPVLGYIEEGVYLSNCAKCSTLRGFPSGKQTYPLWKKLETQVVELSSDQAIKCRLLSYLIAQRILNPCLLSCCVLEQKSPHCSSKPILERGEKKSFQLICCCC